MVPRALGKRSRSDPQERPLCAPGLHPQHFPVDTRLQVNRAGMCAVCDGQPAPTLWHAGPALSVSVCSAPHCLLTLALVVEEARLALVPHFGGHVLAHTGDAGHRRWLQQDNTVVALTPGHSAVLQGPGLVHLEQGTSRVLTWGGSWGPITQHTHRLRSHAHEPVMTNTVDYECLHPTRYQGMGH